MKISKSRLSMEAWDAFVGENDGAIQQSWNYGASSSAKVLRLDFTDEGRRVGCAQILLRSMFGLFDVGLMTRGPVWKGHPRNLPRGTRKAAGATILLCTPEANAPQTNCALITGATHLQIDISCDKHVLRAKLNGKWRNQLSRAEHAGLRVSECRDLAWILQREDENRTRAKYRGLPAEFIRKFCADPSDWRLFIAHHGNAQIAGALFLLHGERATYQCGWSGEEGRRLNAQKLVLWQSMLALKKSGVVSVDLGAVDTETAPGLARFKLGMGGAVKRLGATGLVLS